LGFEREHVLNLCNGSKDIFRGGYGKVIANIKATFPIGGGALVLQVLSCFCFLDVAHEVQLIILKKFKYEKSVGRGNVL
jgi:hypothetical protein